MIHDVPSLRTWLLATLLAAACASPPKSDDPCTLVAPGPVGQSPAAQLNAALGLQSHLAIGVGNDLVDDGSDALAWRLSEPPAIHYLYLVGLGDRGGWSSWNADGSFIDRHAAAARQRCVVPAFTLYAMAAGGEGDPATAADTAYMAQWWKDFELALERLRAFGQPALLHIEPDFWGFMQKHAGGDPSTVGVEVRAHAPDCVDLDDTLAGFGRCVVRRVRSVAPSVRLGFHASLWADPDPSAVGRFLMQAGAAETDLLFVETLDRDAGCFEARGAGCSRDDGPWYWDATNVRSPNFAEHLQAAATLHAETGLPLVWWQMPMGAPSDEPGGVPGRYRDNRLAYVFDHPEEFVAAGGAAVLFGAGWDGQTDLSSDGGQFARRWAAYRRAPTALP